MRWVTFLAFTLVLFVTASICNISPIVSTEPVVNTGTELISLPEKEQMSSVPDDISIPLGSNVKLSITGFAEVDLSSTDSTVITVNTCASFDSSTPSDTVQTAIIEDGCYYRLHNIYYGYISTITHEDEGLSLVQEYGDSYTIWKAEKTQEGYRFSSPYGYMTIINHRLYISAEGSIFSLNQNYNEFKENFSIVSIEDSPSCIYCLGAGNVGASASYGTQNNQSMFFFNRVNDAEAEYTEVTFTGRSVGNTSVTVNGKECSIHVYEPEGPTVSYEAENNVIIPVNYGNSQILYLPSSADYSALNLNLPKGTIVSSGRSNTAIRVTENYAALNLTSIFDDMSVIGKVYSIRISAENDSIYTQYDLFLVKSENVDSMFVEVANEGTTDMVEWLNASKGNIASTGSIHILSKDNETVFSGELTSFHMRGNSNTGSRDLKPSYSLKLSKKAKLIDEVKAKSWCLVASGLWYRDNTMYATTFGETLYQRMVSGTNDYAIQYKPVNLYINGEYRGMYLLVDKIDDKRVQINESAYSVEDKDNVKTVTSQDDEAIRIGIQEYIYSPGSVLEESGEGGYVLEISGFIDSGSCGFVSSRGVAVEIKEPGTPTKEQVQKIAIYYQKFEDALYTENGNISDYIDVASFARLYTLKSFLEDMDFFWGSTYMYINADASGFTSSLASCTAWDFDGCKVMVNEDNGLLFDANLGGSNSAVDYKWQFLEHDDFVSELHVLTEDKVFENGTMSFTDLVSDMCSNKGFIDRYFNTVNAAMCMNKVLWTDTSWTFEDVSTAERIKGYLEKRLEEWKEFFSVPVTISGIPER